jgi:hypothetical protein
VPYKFLKFNVLDGKSALFGVQVSCEHNVTQNAHAHPAVNRHPLRLPYCELQQCTNAVQHVYALNSLSVCRSFGEKPMPIHIQKFAVHHR